MKYFYLYIFLLISFIIAVSYYNTYINVNTNVNGIVESFNSNKQTFVLLGDSIIKNNAYVSQGKSIDIQLQERTNGKSVCLAEDHSTIDDIYSQIKQIPDSLNASTTTIFLSAGGNDILSNYVDREKDVTDSTVLNTIFTDYKKLINNIQTKFSKANIVLIDIYYPNDSKYKKYHPIINEWNKMVYDYSSNQYFSVLKVSNLLTKPEDFSNEVEPSYDGSKKIVEAIMSAY